MQAFTRTPAILLFCLICTCTCSPQQELRQEVLAHYSGEPRKRTAAKYLTDYMEYHWSYDADVYDRYCGSMREIWSSGAPVDAMMEQSMALSRSYSDSLVPLNDSRLLTADYLIRNIDLSFEMWENSPQLRHLSFDDFCEYVLPYKCLDGQPISNWKEDWSGLFTGELPVTSQLDCFDMNARKAAEALTYPYRNRFVAGPRNVEGFSIIPIFDLETGFLRPYDACIDNARLGLLNCRSKGVPVSLDYMPNWAYTAGRHYWNCVYATRRRNENYEPFRIKPGDKHFRDNPMAKVYRLTWRPDSKFLRLMRAGHKLPSGLELCSRDVTDEYTRVADIKVKVPLRYAGKVLGLSVFDNNKWVPVDVNACGLGRVRFRKAGVGVLYAVTSNESGAERPVTDPFILDLRGEMQTYTASDTETACMSLRRKFPSLSHIYNSHRFMHGGRLEGSNDSAFKSILLAADFPADSIFSCSCIIPDTVACRYWRLTPSCSPETHMAELFFYNSEGKEIRPGQAPQELIDRDALTYLSVSDGTPAVLDFGHPVNIARASCIRRGDGNDIIPGDEYELYCWRDGDWRLVGSKTADDIKISFNSVPVGGLYYIRDVSRGTQNRTFIWNKKRNKPEWY